MILDLHVNDAGEEDIAGQGGDGYGAADGEDDYEPASQDGEAEEGIQEERRTMMMTC